MANVNDLKSAANVANLDLVPALNVDGTDSGFVTYWDDNQRVRVVMHKDTAAKVQANRTQFLAWRKEDKASAASGKAYTQYMAFIPKAEPVFSF